MSGGGGQDVVQTGPSVAAAGQAAQAQITASQIAAQAATANTQSAIQALMGEYNTSLGIQQPIIDYGNSAAGQLNYMLGLAPAPLPTAPTAPTAPTMQQALSGITNADINSYVEQNISQNSGSLATQPFYTYNGIQSGNMTTPTNPNAPTSANPLQSWGATSPWEQQTGAIKNYLAQQDVSDPNSQLNQTYNTNQQLYQQQLNQYNQQLPIAQNYQNLGQAKASDINNIVTNLPGYQFQENQGINAIQNAASASGMLNSSNLLQGLNQFGQGLASQYYQNYVGNLQGLAGLGTGQSQQAANNANALGSSIANLQANLGNTQANAALSAGQAEASSYLSPVQNQQMITTRLNSGGGGGAGSLLGGVGGLLTGLGGLGGTGGLSTLFSSRELKDTLETPSTETILENVKQLELDKWKYKNIDESHIGPYAEQFKELFGVGNSQSINIIDMFGVLIGAVKELSKKIEKLESK